MKKTYLATCSILLLWMTGCDSSTPEALSSSDSNQPDAALPSQDRELVSQPSQPTQAGNSSQGDVGDDSSISLDSSPGTAVNSAAPNSLSSQADNATNTEPEILNRPFVTLQAIESDEPDELLQHLEEVDAAIGDLVVAGSNNIVEKELFVSSGIRLGKMKLRAGERLANSQTATPQQRKSGVLAQLVALSHLSGIGDVKSAQQLETLARSMATSEDPDLAHQSRVVLTGFQLQALQNGVEKDPNELLAQIQGLFQRPEDRNFPEFMMLQQANFVLAQMGFREAADQIRTTIATEYEDVPDPQLRGEAWYFAARDSQALENYNLASSSLGTKQFHSEDLLAAARRLVEQIPRATTVEQLATAIANFEYGGAKQVSGQLAAMVSEKLSQMPDSFAKESAAQLVENHQARTGIVGKPILLEHLVGFDGEPMDWSQYEGKVVLIDFWATWCVPCLREIPNMRNAYEELSREGFEIVGINMDESFDAAEEFINQQAFPWRNFYFQDAAGFQSKFAKQHGLTMIPFIVVIGQDGKVTDIHVRGENIQPTIRRLLGLETSLIP